MGNCLGGENEDDITPLSGAPGNGGSRNNSDDYGENGHHNFGDRGPSPIYRSQEPTSSDVQRSAGAEHQRHVVEPPPPYYSDEAPSSSHYNNDGRWSPVKMSEEEQMKLAKKLGLLHQIPTDIYIEGGKGGTECIICMLDFEDGEDIRFLPCLHTYHLKCIDEWLLKSFTCPSCMEPVDSALFSSYQTADLADLGALSTSPAVTAATARKSGSSGDLQTAPDAQESVKHAQGSNENIFGGNEGREE